MPPTTFGWVLSCSDGKTRRGKLEHAEWADLTLEQVLQKLDEVVPEIPRDKRRLIHLGKILNKDTGDNAASYKTKTLKECGIKRGSVMWIMKVPEKFTPMPMEPREMTEAEMQQFFVALAMAIRTPQFSVVMKRLTEDKDNLNNLVAACPGLEQDQVALALLAKPENLMMVFTPDPHSAEQGMDVWKGKMQKMAKDHPALLQAIENMIAAVHEEKPSGAVDPVVAEQLATSYHLDEMDDELAADEDDEDDDMMMDTGAAGGGGGSDLQRNRSFSAITPDQLAAAIAAAQAGVQAGGSGGGGGRGRNPGAAGLFGMTGMAPASASGGGGGGGGAGPSSAFMAPSTSSSASSTSRPTPSSPAITSDMFAAAIAQAMAATGTGGAAASSSGGSRQQSSSEEDTMRKNLQHMREMGIQDESLARKALTVMGGDLQAAIDLIFSGWLGQDD